jgi:hypothetical protein
MSRPTPTLHWCSDDRTSEVHCTWLALVAGQICSNSRSCVCVCGMEPVTCDGVLSEERAAVSSANEVDTTGAGACYALDANDDLKDVAPASDGFLSARLAAVSCASEVVDGGAGAGAGAGTGAGAGAGAGACCAVDPSDGLHAVTCAARDACGSVNESTLGGSARAVKLGRRQRVFAVREWVLATYDLPPGAVRETLHRHLCPCTYPMRTAILRAALQTWGCLAVAAGTVH